MRTRADKRRRGRAREQVGVSVLPVEWRQAGRSVGLLETNKTLSVRTGRCWYRLAKDSRMPFQGRPVCSLPSSQSPLVLPRRASRHFSFLSPINTARHDELHKDYARPIRTSIRLCPDSGFG